MAKESFQWALWSSMASAILMFLYVFSISVAYVAGGYILNPIVMSALAFLIPYFSYWALPIGLVLFSATTNRPLIV